MKSTATLLKALSVFFVFTLYVQTSLQAQNYLINEDFSGFPGDLNAGTYNGWKNITYTGDTAVDTWIFDNTIGYSVPSPLSGQVALVDNYNGGYTNTGSNHANTQNISLHAPVVSTVGLANLTLTFDYLYLRLNTPNIYVEVSTNGTSWTSVWTSSTIGFFGTSASVNLSAYTGEPNLYLRFRWNKTTTGTTYGYWMLDNVKLFSRYQSDVGVEEVVLPMDNPCPDANQAISLKVTNYGTTTASGVNVNLDISGASSGSFSTTIGSLAPGASSNVFTSQSINTTSGGGIVFNGYTTFTNDSSVDNDTLNKTITTAPTPTDPTGPDVKKCGPGFVPLSASALPGEETVWYEDASTNTALGQGNPFNTPYEVQSSRSFYAENTRNLPSIFTSYLTGVYRYNSASEKGIFFDVTTTNEILIDSFAGNFAYAGRYICSVFYKTNSYTSAITNKNAWTLLGVDTIDAVLMGQEAYIGIGDFRIGAGNTYGFCITSKPLNSGLPPFAFKLATVNISNADMTVYSNHVAETAFANSGAGYGADVNIYYQKVCKSQRKPINVVVIPLPVTSLNSVPGFNGNYNSGDVLDPDIVKVGDTVNYELAAPTGYTNSDFGTDWTITAFSFNTANGTGPNGADTATTLPGTNPGSFRFSPSSMDDSVLILSVTILDLNTMCDITLERYIYVAADPHAAFQASSACPNEEITFANNSFISSGNLTYKWYFGDGDSSDLAYPSHIYGLAGTYDVKLIATSSYGYSSVFDSSIVVYEDPVADFLVTNSCDGIPVGFADASYLPAGTPIYSWDFGDGQTGSNVPSQSHLYNPTGYYSVSMTVEVNGCSDTKQKFATQAPRAVPAFSSVSSCNNKSATFINSTTLPSGTYGSFWKFGDGGVAGNKNPKHDYTGFGSFDVTLIVTTDFDCQDSVTQTVSILEAPVPIFSVGSHCAGEAVSFVNSTNLPPGTSNSYSWNFGDGTSDTLKDPVHTFASKGEYTITLEAQNSAGCNGSVTQKIFFDEKPQASFVAQDVCFESVSKFKNNTVASDALTYRWDFGNGIKSAIRDTSFVYANPGTYDVMLYAETFAGCIDSFEKKTEVFALPNATFTFSSGLNGEGTIAFTGPVGGHEYLWFFGDGSKGTNQNEVHQYTQAGYYETELFVTTAEGCMSHTMQVVESTPLGVTSQPNEFLKVYPNPSDGLLFIDLTGINSTKGVIILRDMSGREVYSAKVSDNKLITTDLSSFSQGAYVLWLITPQNTYHQKISLIK